ncbi:MAG: 50S ribosomal protein L18 [Gammaproteobacteria bacterium 39-13]|nr:50S ribosomal protein L18 [Gammaproteobacteria bacterium]OJV92082.1 MAG: 50S ribosomal protein L18 [Gammaproteobacteria bacterium 39-13]
MNKKRSSRFKRAQRTREHIKRLGREKGIARLCINRSAQHIYVQVIAPEGGKILAQASSLEKAVKDASDESTKTDKAKQVGKLIAERAKQAGIDSVASERSGYRYHGRVAALVQSAREHGLVV